MHNNDRHIYPNNKFSHDYGLTIALFALMIISLVAQYYTGWVAFSATQIQHGDAPQIWGEQGYIWEFLQATFENWQSEFLQLWTFILLTTYLIHRNSPQSRDSGDEMADRIEKLEKAIARIENHLGTK